jgi:hypothetical protein
MIQYGLSLALLVISFIIKMFARKMRLSTYSVEIKMTSSSSVNRQMWETVLHNKGIQQTSQYSGDKILIICVRELTNVGLQETHHILEDDVTECHVRTHALILKLLVHQCEIWILKRLPKFWPMFRGF